MGEIADDIIDGACCSICGLYFVDEKTGQGYEHGYPVVCWSCWEDLDENEQMKYSKAEQPTF